MADLSASITLNTALEPQAVDTFVAAAASAVQIDLSFFDNGPFAADYQVQYGTDPTFAVNTEVIVPGAPLSGIVHSVMGLITATLYYFRVRARNSEGNSIWVETSETTL